MKDSMRDLIKTIPVKVNWVKLIKIVAPPILGLIPGLPATIIAVIVEAMATVEELPINGEDKKANVLQSALNTGASEQHIEAISKAIDASVSATNASLPHLES